MRWCIIFLRGDQMAAMKALHEESNQLRRQMLIELQEIRKVLDQQIGIVTLSDVEVLRPELF